MNLNEEQRKEFEKLSKQLIEWLNNNCHPHTSIVVTPTNAELLEGVCAIQTMEFVKD